MHAPLHSSLLRLLALTLIAVALPPILASAQDRTVTGATMFGLGGVRQQDTYLSPLNFKGKQFSFLRETMRMTHWASSNVSFQTLMHGEFSLAHNRPKTSEYWGAQLGYDLAWHRNWNPCKGLRLMVGGLVAAETGILYHTRNGNNPVQGRLHLQAALSAAASYGLRLRRIPLTIRYQADLPVAGVMFSPQFGQSYFEISQGNRDHNVCATHPANAFSIRQMCTIDIPVRRYALRIGYLSNLRQSRVNDISIYNHSRSFLVGFVREFTIHRSDWQRKATSKL